MREQVEIKQSGKRANAFGFLRLLFASLVIVAHTPELVDGNQNREIMMRLFGTMTFGGLAVNGFFLISGYLITASFCETPKAGPYLASRIARIYPAFIVASLVSLAIFAPLGGASLKDLTGSFIRSIVRMLLLQPSEMASAFTGNPHWGLNGPMWTIVYEFRCYLLVLALGTAGLLQNRKLVAALAAASLLLPLLIPAAWFDRLETAYHVRPLGISAISFGLTGTFLAGSCFYLWRDQMQYSRLGMWIAAVVLLIGLFTPANGLAVATAGGYLVFAAAFSQRFPALHSINSDGGDISYGIYLYAWPIEQLIIQQRPDLPLLVIGAATLLAAAGCGWVSWCFVEKPIMRLAKKPRVGPG